MRNKHDLHFEELFLSFVLTRWKDSRDRSGEASLQDASAVRSPGRKGRGQIHMGSEYEVRKAAH